MGTEPARIAPAELRTMGVPLANRLSAYLAVASPLIRSAQTREIPPVLVQPARLAAVFRQTRTPLEELRGATCANVWSTAALGTDEVRVCGVLSKLWDWHHYGREGRAFLARCLHVLGPDRVPSHDELRGGYRIQTEHCPIGDIADRVDITLETARSIVGVEVKIHAGEGERQLSRYVETIARRARLMRRGNAQVIFLSPRRPTDRETPAVWMTWQQVADAAVSADRTNTAGMLIHEFGTFCRALGR